LRCRSEEKYWRAPTDRRAWRLLPSGKLQEAKCRMANLLRLRVKRDTECGEEVGTRFRCRPRFSGAKARPVREDRLTSSAERCPQYATSKAAPAKTASGKLPYRDATSASEPHGGRPLYPARVRGG